MIEAAGRAAATPRILWIELTSKCPFDCVFCSRKLRRGAGEHLPFALFQRLIDSLDAPRKLILNYSGESIYYPELIPAIQLGRARGASVELVSAFSSIPQGMLGPLALCGLGRLTVSVHAADPETYAEIYRYSSFENLEERLREFLSICREAPDAPVVDFAFVAMRRNMGQLPMVAGMAARHGISGITVFPVMRRDEIPVQFPDELIAPGVYSAEFDGMLRQAIQEAEARAPSIRISLATPTQGVPSACLGEVPVAFPGPLPDGARIHSCEQNPWETAHVLSNGDVVACEVLDRVALGNLHEQPIEEIWGGEAYRNFRLRYRDGAVPECRNCAWKQAYLPGPLQSEIEARRGGSPQLLHGWHPPVDGQVIWGSARAAAILAPRSQSPSVHVSALLPAGPGGQPNALAISCNGREIGRVVNDGREMSPFGLDFPVPADTSRPWALEFSASQVLRPRALGQSEDNRDLGFAIVLLKSNPAVRGPSRRTREIAALRRRLSHIDSVGGKLRQSAGFRFALLAPPSQRPGISIVIPEGGSQQEFTGCLEAVEAAAARLDEPVQTIVVVNGADPSRYETLRRRHSRCVWQFFDLPLGFPEAIRRGLKAVRHDWVYLLNSDMVLDAGALVQLARHRAPDVFAIGSQIFLKDGTRYREETNWTAFLIEDGLARVHDRVPPAGEISECFYAGGGSSLFQTRLLASLVRGSLDYAPFYWEDVEWGWRARKRGYRVLFDPRSVAHHRQRATISRYFDKDTIESVTERNRLLFQFRNMTGCGSLDRLFEEISRSPVESVNHLLHPAVARNSLRIRLWNHLTARDDHQILCQAGGAQP